MRKEAHIYFDEELYQAIKSYSIEKQKSMNHSINALIRLGLDANVSHELISSLRSQLTDHMMQLSKEIKYMEV